MTTTSLTFFDNFFDDFFKMSDVRGSVLFPKTDIIEYDTHLQIICALAGWKKEDINIEIKNDVLVISGKKSTELSNSHYIRREMKGSSFERSWKLPSNILDCDNVEASYTDGLLNIILKKRNNQHNFLPKKIDIK